MNWSLNELGHQLFAWLGPVSIELAVLALVVLAAGRLVRSPALRHLLWLAVLVKPLVALGVSSPYTVFAPLAPLAEPGWDAIAHGRVEHLAALVPAGAATASTSAPLVPAGWAALLWLVGTTLLAGRILVGFGILRRLRRHALVQRDGPLFEALRRARAALDFHPAVDVATSPSIRSPMVLGILRPLIVVPTQVVERLSPGELSLVLMHELAHVRRCDNLSLLLQRLVTAALFFHPALWLCGRMLRREAERACDDLVVCATGRPEAYARGLAQVAEGATLSDSPASRIPVMSTLAATESDLSQRIRRTLDGHVRRMGMGARVLAVILLCPLAAVTMPSYGAADNGAVGEPAAAAVSPDSTPADGIREKATAIDPDGSLESAGPGEGIAEGVRGRIHAVAESGEVTVTVHRGRRPEVVLIHHPANGDSDRSGRMVHRIFVDQDGNMVRHQTVTFANLKDRIRKWRQNLLIVVDQNGNMKLNNRPVILATLGEELKKERILMDSTSMIVIQGHERASHGQIVKIMDIARQEGLVHYQLQLIVEPLPAESTSH